MRPAALCETLSPHAYRQIAAPRSLKSRVAAVVWKHAGTVDSAGIDPHRTRIAVPHAVQAPTHTHFHPRGHLAVKGDQYCRSRGRASAELAEAALLAWCTAKCCCALEGSRSSSASSIGLLVGNLRFNKCSR